MNAPDLRPCDCFDFCGDDPALAQGRAEWCPGALSRRAALAKAVEREAEQARLLAAMGFAEHQTLEAVQELQRRRSCVVVEALRGL